jgi:diketogulonate reductase-like aldo/keto reductase
VAAIAEVCVRWQVVMEVLLKWNIQRGVPVSKASSEAHMRLT